jgi:hypothetical protein
MSEKPVSRDELREINYRRRADSGDIFCMHELGSILETRGEIDSITGAEYWYRRAIQLGSKAGQKKLDALLGQAPNINALQSKNATSVGSQGTQLDEYELLTRAESGDSTDSYRYAMHLKNGGASGGGPNVHCEYWFRRARDQGHLGAATELELVKSASVEALRAVLTNKFDPRASTSQVEDASVFDYLKDPYGRGENATVSDLWIKEKAQLATEEWLTEIFDRAEFMKKYLRKSIDKKIALELADNVVLSVELSGNIVTGHLESSRKLIEVKFDLDSLETTKPINDSHKRLAFGLALSWFIDLSIVLKSVRTSSSIFIIKPLGIRSTNSNPTNVGVRYVPTPRFHSAQQSIGSGEGVKKVRHSVSGHKRTLGDGLKPSSKARNRAPKYLKSHMKQNETWVRPHSRGEDEDRKRYELRLSKYSACAHALVELKV